MSRPKLSPEEKRASIKRARDKYRAANREKLNEAQRERRKANLPLAAARMRDYRARRPEVIAAIEARRVRPEGFREKFNAYRAEWAKANPDKIREFSHRRAGRRVDRLPNGTIKRIGNAQRWRCAACATCLRAGYHMDHILPLARGGEHRPENIQLLCPPCNLAKAAKDPIRFMQERGKLL